MDIRSLACFIAVAEQRHFRRAAALLHMTQPTLSQRIRVLEDEVGVALFQRDRRSVELTPAGDAFLEPARASVANARLALRQAREAEGGRAGQLRLGFTVIAFYGALPSAVREFRLRYPEVRVELTERSSPELEAALVAQELDLGILHPPLSHRELGIGMLADQQLMLALPAGHRLALKPRIAVNDLENEPWLMSPRRIGPNFYDRVLAYFQLNGISPMIVQEVMPMTTLVGLVAAGVGLGLVTEGIAEASRPDVAFRHIDPSPPCLPLAAAWLGTAPSSSGRRFLEIVKACTEGA